MTYKKHLTDFATTELRRIGFLDIPIGETILTLLEQSSDISNDDPKVIKQIFAMLSKLIDNEVLSPITESDFVDEGNEIKRCTRYPYLYQSEDGKYYDDRAIGFRKKDSNTNDIMYIYQSGNSSKQEVDLPYIPITKIELID